ncbi:MAG: zinc ABC transporter substrate-binding protein [Myxococcota bacterium]|nr:zinc ABC transporter substrate-binding protein [Myxococcota bacterium]
MFSFVMALLAMASACGSEKGADERPIVVVTLLPQAYFVERLALDSVQVEVMIPPGAGHSTYEPTAGQLSALAQARLYVKVGHPSFTFETAWLDKVVRGSTQLRVVDSSVGVNRDDDDPHFWMAPDGARLMARNIAAGLALLLPEKASDISSNLAALEKDIDSLDAEIKGLLAGTVSKRFYVFHPAFGHFARQYGLEQVAIEHGHKEPSPDELRRVLQAAKADGAKAILVQPQYSKEAAGVVAAETGAPLVEVDPESRQWLASMRQAARAIAEALAK